MTYICAGIRVQQQLVGIETMAVLWLVGAIYPIAITGCWLHAWQIAVPDLVRVLREFNPLHLFLAFTVEEANFNLRRILRKNGEVRPATVPRRSSRVWITFTNVYFYVASHLSSNFTAGVRSVGITILINAE
jgi:hypothetical protein